MGRDCPGLDWNWHAGLDLFGVGLDAVTCRTGLGSTIHHTYLHRYIHAGLDLA